MLHSRGCVKFEVNRVQVKQDKLFNSARQNDEMILIKIILIVMIYKNQVWSSKKPAWNLFTELYAFHVIYAI